MARVLISEPQDEDRQTLERMVARLGHEPVSAPAPTPQQLTGADVLLIEPAAPIGVVLAQAARLIDPTLPLIAVSASAPAPELAELDVRFAATLVRPFTADQLGAAIELALRTRHGAPRRARRDEDDDLRRSA